MGNAKEETTLSGHSFNLDFPYIVIDCTPSRHTKSFYLNDLLHFSVPGGSVSQETRKSAASQAFWHLFDALRPAISYHLPGFWLCCRPTLSGAGRNGPQALLDFFRMASPPVFFGLAAGGIDAAIQDTTTPYPPNKADYPEFAFSA